MKNRRLMCGGCCLRAQDAFKLVCIDPGENDHGEEKTSKKISEKSD